MEIIPFPKPKLHLFVCINDRSAIPGNATPSCGPRIRPDDVKEVKRWIRENGWTSQVYCTQAKCLGFCNAESSVACLYPEGKFVKGIQTVEDVKELIREEIEGKK